MFSNSRLYKYCAGWHGILNEAQPNILKLLYENCLCAIIIPEGTCFPNADGVRPQQYVCPCTTRAWHLNEQGVNVLRCPLSAMLEEIGVSTRINLFSLDVEVEGNDLSLT
jgi:hypothetical protein